MPRIVIILLAVLILGGLGYFIYSLFFVSKMAVNVNQTTQQPYSLESEISQASTQLATKQLKIQFQNGGEKDLQVEIAENNADRAKGLMFRTHLPSDNGMLFIFERQVIQNFWMKNTLIPLDMIFADSKGVIVDIIPTAQPCIKDPCIVYSSKRPARYVLELNAGAVNRLGIRVGDRMQW